MGLLQNREVLNETKVAVHHYREMIIETQKFQF